ncbi:MAG: hypothetical protein ACI4JW_03580 [Oscillospiraceae bacterium]
MNDLKKKIIYYYIIITIALLIAEWYLFCLFDSHIPVLSRLLGISSVLLKGIGWMLIDELLNFINKNGVSGTDIFAELCAMPDKIPFYEKFGFAAIEAQRLRKMYRVL